MPDPIIRAEYHGNKYDVPESWCERSYPTIPLTLSILASVAAGAWVWLSVITIGS